MNAPQTVPSTLFLDGIQKIIPHRYPFLLVDRILDLDIDKGIIVGQKNVTANEPFFQGHFPGMPIMPGVLIIEALAQTGGVLIHRKGGNPRKVALLMSIDNAKFRRRVVPGDILLLRCEAQQIGSRAGRVAATATVEDSLAAEAHIGFVFVDSDQI